ncbi:MAG: ANTAR domain-containing protein [Gammaproteobacteria bacterium]|nr:ANTAR domain-containing protein [Gammaproteobacteria bacterium]
MGIQTILLNEVPAASQLLRQGLQAAGHEVVAEQDPGEDLLAAVQRHAPRLLVLNLRTANAILLGRIAELNRVQPLAVVLFVEVDRRELLERVMQCGVSAYVVDGLQSERIEPIVNTALARFALMSGLRRELADTRQVLAGRKAIDRAKGVIMARRGCTEDEAYSRLRKLAMDRNQRMAEVAENVVATAALFEAS